MLLLSSAFWENRCTRDTVQEGQVHHSEVECDKVELNKAVNAVSIEI